MANHYFSVIIPAKNAATTIATAIESVIVQSNENAEIIVVDDASTDATLQIAKRYAEENNNIRFIHSFGHGVSAARNSGIHKALGQYIIFLDADDYLEEGSLLSYKSVIQKVNNPDLVLSGYKRVTEKRYVIGAFPFLCNKKSGLEILPQYLTKDKFTHLGAICFRTDFLRSAHIEFQPFCYAEDIVFVAQALSSAQKTTCIEAETYCWTLRKGSALYTNTLSKFDSLAALRYLNNYLAEKNIVNKKISNALGNHYGMLIIDITTTLLWMGRSVDEVNNAFKKYVDWAMVPNYFCQSRKIRKDLFHLRFFRKRQLEKWKVSFVPGNFKKLGIIKY